MKYLSVFLLAIFINFTALPGIAVMMDWELPTLSTNISEEEVKDNYASFNEKIPPRAYDFKDFFTLSDFKINDQNFILTDDALHLKPFISIFSPPPELWFFE